MLNKEYIFKSHIYNIIKVIVTILVVIGHCSRMYTNQGVITPACESNVLIYITNFIYSFHMPLFMCISGCVYGLCRFELNKYNNKKDFIANKIKRLLVPYLFIGFFYVAPVMCLLSLTENSYIEYVLNGIIFGQDSRHLWFLTTLFFIFVIMIFFDNKIYNNKNVLLICIIFIIINILSRFVRIVIISNTMQYLFYFFLGVIINKYFYKIFNNYLNITYIFLFLFIYILSLFYNVPAIILGTLGINFFFSVMLIINKYIIKIEKYNIFLKKYSFGIYLFHPMIIYGLFYVFKEIELNPILLSFEITLLSIIVSCLIVKIMHAMKLDFLIGR